MWVGEGGSFQDVTRTPRFLAEQVVGGIAVNES